MAPKISGAQARLLICVKLWEERPFKGKPGFFPGFRDLDLHQRIQSSAG